jgi:hypothetical protein
MGNVRVCAQAFAARMCMLMSFHKNKKVLTRAKLSDAIQKVYQAAHTSDLFKLQVPTYNTQLLRKNRKDVFPQELYSHISLEPRHSQLCLVSCVRQNRMSKMSGQLREQRRFEYLVQVVSDERHALSNKTSCSSGFSGQ